MTDKRLMDLELKMLAQEHLTQELNAVVYGQQKQIDELRAVCAALAKRVASDEPQGADAYTQERPPHY